ncbi:MAG: acyl carrier protein [Gammaproteobacteria bacterium]|nr:acyl carrier protein [Gammaproteobacteria bacterium]
MSDLQCIKAFVLKNFLFTDDASALSDNTSLIGEGIIDSTGILELVSYLEESFSIKVADEEMTPANFDSIQNIAAFVGQKRPH